MISTVGLYSILSGPDASRLPSRVNPVCIQTRTYSFQSSQWTQLRTSSAAALRTAALPAPLSSSQALCSVIGTPFHGANSQASWFLNELADRLHGSGSTASTFKHAIHPRRGNGFAGLASKSRSPGPGNFLPLVPKTSRSTCTRSTDS